jgi:hypothetical protein
MDAELMIDERYIISENAFAEMVVWRLSSPISGSKHHFKYRLALIVDSHCVLRYDNEAGKGDHKHVGENEIAYVFTTHHTLLDDFWKDIDSWRL